jgi:ketosteroid isomerase-like protein
MTMNEAAEQTLIDLETEWSQAIVANDAEAIGRFMADDWSIIGPDGSVNHRNSFLRLIRSGTLRHTIMDATEFDIRVYGDAAVVIARGISGGTFQGHDFRAVERVSDVWVRVGGHWRCVLTHLSGMSGAEEF